MASTQVSDVVVPEIFTPYTQQLTEQKARLIQSGVLVRDPSLDNLLMGGGLTFNVPSFKDLANDAENVITDNPYDYDGGDNSVPKKTSTSNEIAVRLSRHQSWASSGLAAVLAGADPMASIADRVAFYWARRLQAAFVATISGLFANNAEGSPGGGATQNDMTNDVSGSSFVDGQTNFTTEAFIDACVTMGDSMEDLVAVMVHSVVFARMQKNNLIDFIPDSQGVVQIPTFLGRQVIIDDSMPVASGVYRTWLFGSGALRLGVGSTDVPTEVERRPNAGNGGGEEILHNRVQWVIHPVGNKWIGTAPNGGPLNGDASTANTLAHADSWERSWPERKQIKVAQLITRES